MNHAVKLKTKQHGAGKDRQMTLYFLCDGVIQSSFYIPEIVEVFSYKKLPWNAMLKSKIGHLKLPACVLGKVERTKTFVGSYQRSLQGLYILSFSVATLCLFKCLRGIKGHRLIL